jgi:hypothetical protein
MKATYQEVIDNKGEGIMMKHPLSTYDNGRSSHMLKYKPAFDREAIIIGYKGGVGKYDGLLGSFICRPLLNHDTYMSVDLDDDNIFTLSGMNDAIRDSYSESHPEGTIITYECSGFTDKGVPRFGRYQRIRDDVVIKEHIVKEGDRDNLDKTLVIFQKLLLHYKSEGDSLRAKTYLGVVKALLLLETDKDLEPKNLKSCDRIGQGTRTRIKEIIDTGTLQEYEKIKDYKFMVLIYATKSIFRRLKIALLFAVCQVLIWSFSRNGKVLTSCPILLRCLTTCWSSLLKTLQIQYPELDSRLKEKEALALELWVSTRSYKNKE